MVTGNGNTVPKERSGSGFPQNYLTAAKISIHKAAPSRTSHKGFATASAQCHAPIYSKQATSQWLETKSSGTVREAAGSTACPVLSLPRKTIFMTPWCALSRVQEWRRSLVQSLPWSQMCLLAECYKMGLTLGTFHSVHSTDFSGQDKELSSVTHGVSVSGTVAPPPSPSYCCEKGINYVRTGTSAYYSCTITSSPLTQGSKNRQILCHHQPQMSFPEAHPSPRPIKGLWVLQKYTSETE